VKALALILCSCLLTGCVATTGQQSVQPTELGQQSSGFQQFLRALAGDPQRENRQLFDQIPNWDNEAQRRCCSVLGRQEYLKMRCDTDQPLEGRTNRC
jgi:hypothetical protein